MNLKAFDPLTPQDTRRSAPLIQNCWFCGEAELLCWDVVLRDEIVISRLKREKSSIHPLLDAERQLLDQFSRKSSLLGEREEPLSPATIEKVIQWATAVANLPVKVHSHMMRHSYGYRLANQGVDTRTIQDYLRH